MTTENILADIPTDQLVLKLLQELAARVEKLEKKDEARKELKSSVDDRKMQDFPDKPVERLMREAPQHLRRRKVTILGARIV
jgi:hypothetical protein